LSIHSSYNYNEKTPIRNTLYRNSISLANAQKNAKISQPRRLIHQLVGLVKYLFKIQIQVLE
jgi:hypothetical protein